jgi:hypothetical protein
MLKPGKTTAIFSLKKYCPHNSPKVPRKMPRAQSIAVLWFSIFAECARSASPGGGALPAIGEKAAFAFVPDLVRGGRMSTLS